MTEGKRILETAKSVLVVDWPLIDVPETLARAGYATVEHGGPEPDNYSAYELRDGEVVTRRLGAPPQHADLVYTHRPVDELAGIVEFAKTLGATALWIQSGFAEGGTPDQKGCWFAADESRRAREIVEAAGMSYIQEPYIADAVRGLAART